MGSVSHGGKHLETATDEDLDTFVLTCDHPTPYCDGASGKKESRAGAELC